MELIQYGVVIFGLILCFFAFWFWYIYGLVKKSRHYIPPITTLVVWIVVIAMIFVMFDNEVVKIMFGDNTQQIRENILHILGVIFTGFVLMITILWGLMSRRVGLHSGVLYFQSYLLVGLFFYISAAFYFILADI